MKKLLLFISIVFFFIAAGLFYINKMLLPVHVKGFLLKTAKEQLKGRDISFGDLHFDLLKGLTINRIVVTAKHNPTRAFFQIDKLNIKILLPPLLQKKIIIPSIQLYSPHIKLIRMDDALWNFSDLIPEKKEDGKNPFDIIIGGIKIFNGQISIEDLTNKELFSETLTSINVQTSLNFSHPFHSTIGLKGNFNISSSQGSVFFDTQIGIKETSFKGTFNLSNLDIPRYLALLPKDFSFIPFNIKSFQTQHLFIQTIYNKELLSLTINGSIPSIDIASASSDVLKDFSMKGSHLIFDKFSCSLSATQKISAQGALQTKEFFFYLNEQQHVKTTALSSSLQLSQEKNNFLLNGDFKTTSLDAFLYPLHISGDFDMSKTSFTIQDSSLRLATTLNGKGLSFQMPNIDIKTDTLSTTLNFERNLNQYNLQGDLSAKVLSLFINNHIKISSKDISIKNFSSNLNELLLASLLAKGSLNAQDLLISLNKQFSLKTNVDIPQFSITPQQQTTQLITQAVFKDLLFSWDNQYKIATDLNFNRLSCFFNSTNFSFETDLSSKQTLLEFPSWTLKAPIILKNFQGDFKENTLSIHSNAQFPRIEFHIPESITFQGMSPQASFNLSFNINDSKNLHYDGNIVLNQGTINNIDFINSLTDLNASLSFKNDEILFQQTSFKILNTPLTLEGTLKNFQAPLASITFKAPIVDLKIIETLLPDIVKNEALSIQGQSSLEGSFIGLINNPAEAQITTKLNLKNTTLKSAKHQQELRDITGAFLYHQPKVSFENLQFTWQKYPITFNGFLEDFSNPYSEGTIKTTDISADYILKKTNNTLTIKKLKLSWLHSTLDLLGDIYFPTNAPININFNGTAKASLKDISTFLPQYNTIIDPLKLGGIVKINFQTKGSPEQWQMLESQINIESPSISIMGYMLEDIKLSTQQRQGKLSPLILSTKAYGGNINTTNSLSLTHESFPFESSIHIENLNIESIKNVTPSLSSQQLSGFLTAMGNLKGNLNSYQDMTGKVALSIQNGSLWNINALAGIAKILASIVQSTKDLSIQEASASLEFKNKQILTSDLILKGPSVLIKGQGWIDWDQNIEMSLSPEILTNTSTNTINEDGSTTPPQSTLLDLINPTSNLLHIRLYGKLPQPQIEHNLTTPKMIKKTLQNTVGNLFKLLGSSEQ